MTEIYVLFDPRDGQIRYVGKANNTKSRLKSHIRDSVRRDTPVYRWIRDLNSVGLLPGVHIAAVVSDDQWQSAERLFISELRKTHDLLNVANGGNAPLCRPHVLAKNARMATEKRSATPAKRRMWELKRSMGEALKRGFVAERTKIKLRQLARDDPEQFGIYANI